MWLMWPLQMVNYARSIYLPVMKHDYCPWLIMPTFVLPLCRGATNYHQLAGYNIGSKYALGCSIKSFCWPDAFMQASGVDLNCQIWNYDLWRPYVRGEDLALLYKSDDLIYKPSEATDDSGRSRVHHKFYNLILKPLGSTKYKREIQSTSQVL